MYKFNLSFGVGLQEHIIPAGLCLIWYECRPPGWVGYETPAAAGLLSFTELVGTDSAIKAFPLFTCSVTLLPFAILGLRQQWEIKFIFYYTADSCWFKGHNTCCATGVHFKLISFFCSYLSKNQDKKMTWCLKFECRFVLNVAVRQHMTRHITQQLIHRLITATEHWLLLLLTGRGRWINVLWSAY